MVKQAFATSIILTNIGIFTDMFLDLEHQYFHRHQCLLSLIATLVVFYGLS